MDEGAPFEPSPCAVLVTGVSAAGKSTVGRALAARLARSAFIEGDDLWQMVVGGRVDMAPDAGPEARAQLELRYAHAALLSVSFVRAGFVAVHADNVYGPDIARQLARLDVPAALVVLRPDPAVVAEREERRGTTAYDGWLEGGGLVAAATRFDGYLTAGAPVDVGLWLDPSTWSVARTVDEIVARWDEALVGPQSVPR